MTTLLAEKPTAWLDVEAARDGDRDAFAVIWQAHHQRILAYVLRRVNNHATAEDLTGDVFVRALAGIDRIVWHGRDIGAWLTVIARNIVMDHYRSARVRTTDLHPELNDLDQPDAIDVAELATDRPIAQLLWQAVANLPPEQRDCLRLRFVSGLSVAETSAAMGRNEGAVKALTYRATQGLRRRLACTDLAGVVA